MRESPRTVRIKPGAFIGQDFSFTHWPNVDPPPSDPSMQFQAHWTGKHWVCKADGYGHLTIDGDCGSYGNGKIHVFSYDSVEVLT